MDRMNMDGTLQDFDQDRPELAYTDEVKAATDPLYAKVSHVVTPMEWPAKAPLIHAINQLKKEKNAVILAHNYMTADIFHCVGDLMGDSLALARMAAESEADIIVQAGVHFMAETAKVLAPEKTVLIPDTRAGCSLASSITGEDVRRIKAAYPGIPVVTYVNTSADVKAECDICCTSSNAVQVVESLNSDTVILLPDQYLAKNVAAQTDVKILTWAGSCEVHEQFTAQDIQDLRDAHPGVVIITHPESPLEVVQAADFAGSTAAMADWAKDSGARKAVLLTECSMSDNVAADVPEVEFIRPCNLCPHMKRITLENIYDCLRLEQHEVTVPDAVIEGARASVQAMLDLPKPAKPANFDPKAQEKRVDLVVI
ncbi:MAG: quinolinate synthase NadA [Maricaulis maris]